MDFKKEIVKNYLEHHCSLVRDSNNPVQRVTLPINLGPERQMSNAMSHVEIGGRKRLYVVNMNVIDGERLSGRYMEGSAHPVNF